MKKLAVRNLKGEMVDFYKINEGITVHGKKGEYEFEADEIRVDKIGNTQEQAEHVADWVLKDSGWGSGIMPTLHFDEWKKELIEEVSQRIADYKKGKLTANQLAEQLKSVHQGMETSVDEDEPDVTVVYSDEDDYPKTIGYYHDDTEGDFEAKWHSTDPWRGYYEVESKNWVNVRDDCILSMSADAEELKKFDDALQKLLLDKDIRYARVFARSSNVFSTGYDFFVEKQSAAKVKMLSNLLALRYRDPARFRATALTGADPEQMTPHDKLFVKYASQIMEGKKTFEQIKKELKVKE